MFRRTLSAALAGVTLTAIPLLAARTPDPNSLEAVLRKVQEKQRATVTLQARFRQEKQLALLASPEVSTGTFVFSKPNNVLWSYESPKRVEMVIANGFLTTYYPDLRKAEQIDVKRFEDRIFRYMGASGAIDELARYFDFKFVNKAAEPEWLLDLTPKTNAMAKRVRNIRIWIDKKSYITTKVEYVEGDGDVTRYEFTDVRVNQPVEPKRFVLNLPATVRVEQIKLQ